MSCRPLARVPAKSTVRTRCRTTRTLPCRSIVNHGIILVVIAFCTASKPGLATRQGERRVTAGWHAAEWRLRSTTSGCARAIYIQAAPNVLLRAFLNGLDVVKWRSRWAQPPNSSYRMRSFAVHRSLEGPYYDMANRKRWNGGWIGCTPLTMRLSVYLQAKKQYHSGVKFCTPLLLLSECTLLFFTSVASWFLTS